jgi:hypothetical protein
MKILKKITKRYQSPTPKMWIRIGNALLGVSAMIIPAMLMNHLWIGITLFAIGIIGKFLTNFYTEEE